MYWMHIALDAVCCQSKLFLWQNVNQYTESKDIDKKCTSKVQSSPLMYHFKSKSAKVASSKGEATFAYWVTHNKKPESM